MALGLLPSPALSEGHPPASEIAESPVPEDQAAPAATRSMEDADSRQALARQAEEKCQATASNPPTRQAIVAKVDGACHMLEEEGLAALSRFRGADSPFIFGGTYLWVHDMDGMMLVHPIRYQLEGFCVLGLKDVRGKRLFAEMNEAVARDGSAWIDYYWPKPGEKEPSRKTSYVRLCRAGGRDVVIGCGTYSKGGAIP